LACARTALGHATSERATARKAARECWRHTVRVLDAFTIVPPWSSRALGSSRVVDPTLRHHEEVGRQPFPEHLRVLGLETLEQNRALRSAELQRRRRVP